MSSISMPFDGTGPLLLFLAKATVLLVAAIVATSTLRRSTAGARHLVWLAALAGVLALPVLSRIPALQLGVLPSSFGFVQSGMPVDIIAVAPARAITPAPPAPDVAPASGVVAPKALATPRPARSFEDGAFTPPAAAIASSDAGWTYPVLSTLAAVWALVAVALLGWLVVGATQVRRIVRIGRELTTPDWTTPLCEVADRLDLELPPRLVMSDRIEMAFACRALSPTIVLPHAAESWSDDRRRAVLFHELAHVKRHDLLGHVLGRVACALYWFHPLVWTAAKNLRAESERACDDLVLSCGARPSEYAQHLLDMVTSVRSHGAPVMALPMARKKEFEGRMLAILDPAIRRAAPGRLQAAGVVVSLAALSLTIAAASPATATSAVSVDAPAIGATGDVTAAPKAPEAPAAQIAADVMPVAPVDTPPSAPLPRGQDEARPMPSSDPLPHAGRRALDALVNEVTRASVSTIAPVLRQLGQQSFVVAQSGDSATVSMLIRILETDGDAQVRRTAAWGLNEASGERVQAALRKALKSDADASVREMAAWALGEQSRESSARALADALEHDKSAKVRATSAWALGQIDHHREIGALEAGMADQDAQVRETSVWAIGQLGLRNAPNSLVNGLTDPSRQVRVVTAWALGEIEDKTTADAIIKAFQTESDSQVRSAELRALAVMGAASPALVESALKSTDPEIRRRAVAMLAGGDAGVWVWPWPWPQPRPVP